MCACMARKPTTVSMNDAEIAALERVGRMFGVTTWSETVRQMIKELDPAAQAARRKRKTPRPAAA